MTVCIFFLLLMKFVMASGHMYSQAFVYELFARLCLRTVAKSFFTAIRRCKKLQTKPD